MELDLEYETDDNSSDMVDGKSIGGSNEAVQPGLARMFQPGLYDNQVLQLCYIRQQPRRKPRQHKFYIPELKLSLSDVIPPLPINLSDTLLNKTTEIQQQNVKQNNIQQRNTLHFQCIFNSAVNLFFQTETISVAEKKTWNILSEADWHDVYERAKSSPINDSERIITIPAVTSLLQTINTPAYTFFVWNELVIPLLQHEIQLNTASVLLENNNFQQFLIALLSQEPFISMTPKAFRRKLREKSLNDLIEANGSKIELAILSCYYQVRKSH